MPARLTDLFAAIDRGDAEAFAAFLSADARFRFGNAEPIHGRAAIRDAVAGFFGAIAGAQHTLEDSWDTGNAVVCHGTVRYTRRDGSTLVVPFANVMKMEGERIGEYLIFVDTSTLFA